MKLIRKHFGVSVIPLSLMVAMSSSAIAAGGEQPAGPDSRDGSIQQESIEATSGTENANAMPGSSVPSQAEEDDSDAQQIESEAATSETESPAAGEQEQMPIKQARQLDEDSAADQIVANSESLTSPEAEIKKYLSVVLRVRDDGTSEIVSASEVPGVPQFSNEAVGDYLYEVSDNGTLLARQGIPMELFQGHSFGGSHDTENGHSFVRLDEATVVVKVPSRDLDSELGGLGIKVFKFRTGASPVERFDAPSMEMLKETNALELVSEQKNIGAEIRRIGNPPQKP